MNDQAILSGMLCECPECCEVFQDNAMLMTDEEGHIADDELPSLIIYLNDVHTKKQHADVH